MQKVSLDYLPYHNIILLNVITCWEPVYAEGQLCAHVFSINELNLFYTKTMHFGLREKTFNIRY